MMQNAFWAENVVLGLDLEKQFQLTQFYHKLMQNALFTKKPRFGTRFGETVITNAVLTQLIARAKA